MSRRQGPPGFERRGRGGAQQQGQGAEQATLSTASAAHQNRDGVVGFGAAAFEGACQVPQFCISQRTKLKINVKV